MILQMNLLQQTHILIIRTTKPYVWFTKKQAFYTLRLEIRKFIADKEYFMFLPRIFL